MDQLKKLAAFIGFVVILKWVFKFLAMLKRQFLHSKQNLYRKYGDKDTWAVVSGGSDGLGLQLCKDLAREGFNICMIARDQSKMNEKIEEIKKQAGRKIETMTIVADFFKMTTIEQFESTISDKLHGLDIGILIPNAGWSMMGPFADLRNDEVQATVSVNALHPLYLTKVLLPKMQDRRKRSAILFISSLFGSIPASGIATYSAAKAFATFLGEGLALEVKEKVDVTVYEAGEISTKLLRKRESLTVISTKRAAYEALRQLGRRTKVNGPIVHEAMAWVLGWVPKKMIQKMNLKAGKAVIKRIREKEAEGKKNS